MSVEHSARSITPSELREMLLDEQELALLDVREERDFGAGHILYASCLCASRLELEMAARVPRPAVRLVTCDEDGGALAERAAERLLALGYTDVACLAGGTRAWAEAGFELFSGVNVPSKAFGEFIEERCATPSVSAEDLERRLAHNDDIVVLDARPRVEYEARHIPTGMCVPGGELVYRLAELAPNPSTSVVVNCAGRTRSIIGAQSLINAGVTNPVLALRNGTMGWHLAGLDLETGPRRYVPEISEGSIASARVAAEQVAERAGVRRIDKATLARLEEERDARSLYVFDVRTPEEYASGHLSQSRSAPGGQLVQETDHFVATLGARVVLVDDTGVRAMMSASWLRQMGWSDVFVLEKAFQGEVLEKGPERNPVLGLEGCAASPVAPATLSEWLARDEVAVVDLSLSSSYRAGHIPGAWFAIRARLQTSLARVAQKGRLVLTSEDGVLARLALAEAAAIVACPVMALAGGNAAWREAGLALSQGEEQMADPADDIWPRPYERAWGDETAMQDYLTWEVALMPKVTRDGVAKFRTLG